MIRYGPFQGYSDTSPMRTEIRRDSHSCATAFDWETLGNSVVLATIESSAVERNSVTTRLTKYGHCAGRTALNCGTSEHLEAQCSSKQWHTAIQGVYITSKKKTG